MQEPRNSETLFVRGGEAALGEIVGRYKDRLVNFFWKQLGDRHVAEDLAQEVFVRVFKKAETFREGMPFEPWLFSIARNLSVDYLRKTGRRKQTFTGLEEERVDLGGSEKAEPSRALEKKELGEIVREEIMTLPEKLRSALTLCEFEGFSYESAGSVLGIPAKTVGSRLARARERLRRKMERYDF